VQRRLYWLIYCLGYWACIRWECTLVPPGEYDWNIRVRWWCGLVSDYYDHLLMLVYNWCRFSGLPKVILNKQRPVSSVPHVKQAKTYVDLVEVAFPMLCQLGPHLACDQVLLVKVNRLARSFMEKVWLFTLSSVIVMCRCNVIVYLCRSIVALYPGGHKLFMAPLCSRCGHYIFVLFLSFFFFSLA